MSIDISKFSISSEDTQKVVAYSAKINLDDTIFCMKYASKVQKDIALVVDSIYKEAKELPDNSDIFEDVEQIKAATEKLCKCYELRVTSNMELSFMYNNLSVLIRKLHYTLQERKLIIMQKDAAFEELFEKVMDCYRKLMMYIEAAEMKLASSQSDAKLLPGTRALEERIASLNVTKKVAYSIIAEIEGYMTANKLSLEQLKSISNKLIPSVQKRIKIAMTTDNVYSLLSDDTEMFSTFGGSLLDFTKSLKDVQIPQEKQSEMYLLIGNLQEELKKLNEN